MEIEITQRVLWVMIVVNWRNEIGVNDWKFGLGSYAANIDRLERSLLWLIEGNIEQWEKCFVVEVERVIRNDQW